MFRKTIFLALVSLPLFAGNQIVRREVKSACVLSNLQKASVFYRIGLRSGDQILEFNSQPCRSPKMLKGLQAFLISGKAYRLKFARKGKQQILEYRIPTSTPTPTPTPVPTPITLTLPTEEEKQKAEVAESEPASCRISQIEAGSVFEKMGLENGDEILKIDRSNCQSIDDFQKLFSLIQKNKSFNVLIKRAGKEKLLHFDVSTDQSPSPIKK